MGIQPIWKDEPYKVIEDGDMSQATIVSEVVPSRRYQHVSFHVSWTGSPVGYFTIEASDEEDNASNFVELEMDIDVDETQIRTDGNTENPFLVKIDGTPFRGVRLKYTRESGTGTLTVWAAAKQS
jgi:hypothetical protein